MHRRRHKVPWKLLKRESQEVKKRVFVCPEPTCLHHDPCHALGDLVGIKKHFRGNTAIRNNGVESFIEHQDACTVRRVQPKLQALQPACSSRTASSTSPSSDANFSITPRTEPVFLQHQQKHNLELQLLPTRDSDENYATHLKLSIGSSEKNAGSSETTLEATRLKELTSGQLKLAMAEKAYAEKARQEAKRQIDMAELEFASAKRIRQQAASELEKAQALKDQATKKISATIMQITCQTCKHQFQTSTAVVPDDETSLVMSYMSSATTEGEGE
ncbi:protein BASIC PENTACYSTEINE2-like [Hibiscus syriacus]|uniref:Protein BASIC PENTACYSTEINE2-like n=1 Tax=Hibiscus syriacus TaxID=106335 RepID=A0A6A3B4Y2_HIBSY|nr:protein BASIC PENTACYSTEINE2-like [Hibiscus syriacus]